MTEYIQLFADTLGVSSSVVGIILFLSVAIILSLVTMRLTGSTTLGLLASVGPVLLGAVLGFLPLWIVFVSFLLGVPVLLFSRIDMGGGEKGISIHIAKNTRDLTLRVEKASGNLPQYVNNLDNLLGIRTCNRTQPRNGKALRLTDRGVLLISQDYDWYLTAKHPDQDVFKVVGLHKDDDAKNKVYLLGKNVDSGSPFLTPISSIYLEGDLEECALWAERKGLVALTDESNYTAISAVTSIVPIVFAAVIILGAVNWISKGIK